MELINKIILRTDSIFSLCIDHYFLFFIFDHRKVSIETFFKRSFTYTRIRERFARRKKREETRALFSLSLFLFFSLSLWIRSPIADPFSTRWVLGKPWTTVPFLRKPATPSYVRLCQGERAAISVDRPPRCNYRYTAGCADTGGPFCNDHNRSIGLSIFPPSTRFFSSIISGKYLWYYEIYVWLDRFYLRLFFFFCVWLDLKKMRRIIFPSRESYLYFLVQENRSNDIRRLLNIKFFYVIIDRFCASLIATKRKTFAHYSTETINNCLSVDNYCKFYNVIQ